MLTKKIIKKMNSATKIGSKNRKHPKGGIRTSNGVYDTKNGKFYYLISGD